MRLPILFHIGACLGTHPFRGFSPPSLPDPLGSSRPPCRFPSFDAAAPRISAVSCGALTPCDANGLRGRADAFSCLSVVHGSPESLLSWSSPPFEVTILVLLPASSELLSWASIVNSSSFRLASSRAPVHVRSSEFQRSRRLARSLRAPLRGVWVNASTVFPPKREASRHRRLPVDATDVAFRERGSAPLALHLARSNFDNFSDRAKTTTTSVGCSFIDTFPTIDRKMWKSPLALSGYS